MEACGRVEAEGWSHEDPRCMLLGIAHAFPFLKPLSRTRGGRSLVLCHLEGLLIPLCSLWLYYSLFHILKASV